MGFGMKDELSTSCQRGKCDSGRLTGDPTCNGRTLGLGWGGHAPPTQE